MIRRIVAIIVATLTMTICVMARDRDGRYADSPLKPWFDSLKDKNGAPCCSDADGNVIADADWDVLDGHYRVRLENEWVDVPDHALITRPNLFGRTMVWPYRKNGQQLPRCFMPGAGG